MANSDILLQKIGERIHETRVSRGMSQQQLAARANVSIPHISDIEHGKKAMGLETFIRIIEALQVSADEIIRADVPATRKIYQNEINDLLAGCSPDEAETIKKMLIQLAQTMRSVNKNE